MAVSDETMRLTATVVDQFSDPIRKMIRSVRELVGETEKGHKTSVKHLKEHGERYEKLREAMHRAAELSREEFEPNMKTLGSTMVTTGISLASVATAVGSVISAAVGFGDVAHHLRDLSRATGLAVDDLRVLEDLGPHVGSSAEAMDKAVDSFASHMERLHRMAPAEMRIWGDTIGVDIQQFIRDLDLIPSRWQQVMAVLHEAPKIPYEHQREQFLESFGFPRELARYTEQELDEYIKTIREHQLKIGPLIAGGLCMHEALISLREDMENFGLYLGATFAPDFVKALDVIVKWIDENKDKVKDFIDGIKRAFEDLGSYASKTIEALKPVADFLNQIIAFENKIVDLRSRLGEWARGSGIGPQPKDVPPGYKGEANPIFPDIFKTPPPWADGWHKSAFMVEGGQDLRTAGHATSGSNEAIRALAQGVRIGAYDALTDYFGESPRAAAAAEAGGLMKASYGGANAIGGSIGRTSEAARGASEVVPRATSAEQREVKQAIDELSQKWGVDPTTAERVFGGESSFNRMAVGDSGTSFGVGQFHFGGMSPRMPHAGMGDDFLKATGIDLRDPVQRRAHWREALDFALRRVHERGWGDWSAARNLGIPRWGGVNRHPGALLKQGAGASSKVSGEAELRVKLAPGLAPDGGVSTKGSLFKEVHLERGSVPYASMTS